jgi:DNA-binding transcriptional LysR family regulator
LDEKYSWNGGEMELNQLEVFYTLAKVKSFTRTAKLMFVTQSAISHAVRKLESGTECKLIDRGNRGFRLTPAGRELFYSCERIFREVELARENIRNHRENPVWEISLGSPVEFGNTVLVPLLCDFLQAYPQYRLNFYFSNELEEPLANGSVDFIIDCRVHFGHDLSCIHLFREEYVVIVSPEHPFLERLRQPGDLERIEILSMDRKGEWWRNFLAVLPAGARPLFKKVICINHVRGIINGAAAGMGVGFVPRYTVSRELENGSLLELFPEVRTLADNFCIYIRRDKLALEKNNRFVDYLRSLGPAQLGNPGL